MKSFFFFFSNLDYKDKNRNEKVKFSNSLGKKNKHLIKFRDQIFFFFKVSIKYLNEVLNLLLNKIFKTKK